MNERQKLEIYIVASFIDYEDTEENESQDDIINELIQNGQEQPEIDGNNAHLNEKELDEINLVMKKYKNTFSNKPGVSNVVSHQIRLSTNIPILSRPIKVPFAQKSRLKVELKEMEGQLIIRRSDSPNASPVRKKDLITRICPDYRKLNKMSIFDPEPMIHANDIITNLGKARYFTKLDLCKGYWQIPMKESDIEKNGSITEEGHCKFAKMPFGLINSGATLTKGL